MLRFCILGCALWLASPTFANTPPGQKCTDDNGSDRCSPVAQAKTRDKYGLADIATLIAQGTYVRRTMLVAGYGRDILAVSFVRQKGMDPFVEIRGPQAKGGKSPRSLSMPISLSEWNNVLSQGSYFDRNLAPILAENGKPEPMNICLHSWMVTVEAADPARLSSNTLPAMEEDPEIRTKTQSACDGGLAIQYAFQLADLAYDMLPVCQSIDLELQRDRVTALNTCLSLSGDRAAAGQALSLPHGISKALNIYPKDPAQTQKALGWLIVSADPNDGSKAGSDGITRAERAALIATLQQGDIYFSGYNGIDADHVEIDAMQVQRRGDQPSPDDPQRNIKIYASREVGEFRIYRIDAPAFSR
jgi:hypothetical protein